MLDKSLTLLVFLAVISLPPLSRADTLVTADIKTDNDLAIFPRVAAIAATLGCNTESLWDSFL